MKEECVDLKEKLNRSTLAKDVMEQEKIHYMEQLNKLEAEREETDAQGRHSKFILVVHVLSNFYFVVLSLIIVIIYNDDVCMVG